MKESVGQIQDMDRQATVKDPIASLSAVIRDGLARRRISKEE